MVWGYLSEFWNSVSSTTLNAWEYTESWFQNIGNAVAGALGGLFEFLNHSLSDVFVFLGWLFENLSYIFHQLLYPVKYVFQYTSSFTSVAFGEPATTTNIWSFSTSTTGVLDSIPYWSELTTVIGIALIFIGAIAILKLFLKS